MSGITLAHGIRTELIVVDPVMIFIQHLVVSKEFFWAEGGGRNGNSSGWR